MKNFSALFLVLAAVAMLFACKPSTATTNQETDATATAQDTNSFGAGVTNRDQAITFADMINQLNTQDSVNVIVKAKVSEVCQAKGCWMNLVDNAGQTEEELFVKFKDYAFFVPKDIAGQEVLVEGVAFKEETSVEELKHYAEDAGKSAEEIAAITEPVSEKKFMATGVVLLR